MDRGRVSVICIDCESDYIDNILAGQTYQNLEIVEATSGNDFYQDIADYCEETESEYISFLEPGQKLDADKIKKMVEYAEEREMAEIIFCNRNYIEKDGTIAAHPDAAYRGVWKDTFFDGNQVLRVSVESGNNLLGNLTTTMFRKDKIKLCMDNLKHYEVSMNPAMQKAFLLFELLAGHIMVMLEETLVDTYVRKMDIEELEIDTELFQKQIQTFWKVHDWGKLEEIPYGISKEHKKLLQEKESEHHQEIQKEITFFYTDKGEYYNLLPIMKCAQERGYKTSYTNDLNRKAEIGVYCQHFGMPENSKFSVVLLHDMAQGHNRWPNIWELERWNKYDLGIVPGLDWKDRWERCAFRFFANPRCGAYMLGYPKSNEIFSEELEERVREVKKDMDMKYSFSVLYAPSWENDEKEDDFIRALASLPVNLLVKQASWPEEYDFVIKNIENMRRVHEGKYNNLYYIEPEESIMVALKLCDLIISDESSVMMEGMMFGKPSIAVRDWLIPDTTPSRFASIPFENVFKCKKVELREAVEKFLAGDIKNEEVLRNSEEMFVNKENVNKDILDAIEYFTTGGGCTDFMKWKMSGRYMPASAWM